MNSNDGSSPRKARKSMRSQRNAVAAPNIDQSISNTTSSSSSTPIRKNARKSTGGRNLASVFNQTTQLVPNRTQSSMAISQNTTISLSQPNGSKDDDSSDSDVQPRRTRSSVASSLSSTIPFSQPGCSKDPDSSDSEISPTRKLVRPKSSASVSNNSKRVVAKGPVSSSEDSEAEEIPRRKSTVTDKAQSKAPKFSTSSADTKLLTDPDKLASQCVFYILVANRSKTAIKKRDIIQQVFGGKNTHLFPETLQKAASTLQKTFGLELMELKSSKNEYLLVNNLTHQYGIQPIAEYSPIDHQKQGFIFYILTLIFMNENSILEDELWKALDPLGVEVRSSKPHPIFGDVKKFVTTTLVKQMYLERKQLSKDPPQFELFWGERAHKEVVKEDLLEFVCKIMPDTKPEEWILQYKDAKGRLLDGDAEME